MEKDEADQALKKLAEARLRGEEEAKIKELEAIANR